MFKEEIFILIIAASIGIAFAVNGQRHYLKYEKGKHRQYKDFQKKLIPEAKFVRIFNSILIKDPKVKEVWECMSESIGNEGSPELLLDMLLSIQGESTLCGFNEFGIDDQDFSDDSVPTEDTVCLRFKLNYYYCSKSKLIAAHKKLVQALKEEGIHSYVIWRSDYDAVKYKERFF